MRKEKTQEKILVCEGRYELESIDAFTTRLTDVRAPMNRQPQLGVRSYLALSRLSWINDSASSPSATTTVGRYLTLRSIAHQQKYLEINAMGEEDYFRRLINIVPRLCVCACACVLVRVCGCVCVWAGSASHRIASHGLRTNPSFGILLLTISNSVYSKRKDHKSHFPVLE